MRLWPSLDGRREPVPVRGARPTALSIGHVGDELEVLALDDAGIVTLLRMSPDGGAIDRTQLQLPGDIRALEAVLVGDALVILRADQTVEVFDRYGVARGQLSPPPGENIGALATRHGVAIAVTGGDDGLRTLRWLDLTSSKPGWGKTATLPVPATRIALAPGHGRMAELSALDQSVQVLDIEDLEHMGALGTIPSAGAQIGVFAFGFLDDDHLAIDHGTLQWWVAPRPPLPPPLPARGSDSDPWANAVSGHISPNAAPPDASSFNVDGAIGDRVLVSGVGTALSIAEFGRPRSWLGYADLPNGRLTAVGDELVNEPSSQRMVWLDNDLHVRKVYEAPRSEAGTWTLPPVAVGPHHIVTTTASENNQATLRLVDIDHDATPVEVARVSIAELGAIDVQGDTLLVHRTATQPMQTEQGVVAMPDAPPAEAMVLRYHLDLANFAVTPLAPLVLPVNTVVKLTDPARTDGVVAFASIGATDGFHIATYREGKPGASDRLAPLKPTMEQLAGGAVFAFDDNGRSYTFTGAAVDIRDRRGDKVASIPTVAATIVPVIRRDGSQLVSLGNNEVVGLDARGERWRTPLWGAATVMFSPDESRVLIGTRSGFVVLDPATGKRVDARCGWSFGAYEENPSPRELGESPVCAE